MIAKMSKNEKGFLTYNQQMRKLRSIKHISCNGSSHKRLLVRAGYFNIINGYKAPFICDIDANGNHIYLPETSLDQIYTVKRFDDELRSFILKYITQVEEEIRALTAYAFDRANSDGTIYWFETDAFSPEEALQNKMNVISSAYSELARSKLDYVRFYMENHHSIPTWIMIKAVNFSTFINVLQYSKKDVYSSICRLYQIMDERNFPNKKLLIGALHWMRTVRNSCAHNERIYCISRDNETNKRSGRIIETYIRSLRPSYQRDKRQCLFDLCVYFKYFLPADEFQSFIADLKAQLFKLKSRISENAFEAVRGKMGIKNMDDLDILISLPKDEINYNKFG